MLPGKKYAPEDILLIVKRRFWLLVVPFALVAAGTAVAARKLPDRFRAEAVILVVPQQVPESFVKSTVTTRIEDRLDSIQQTILTRTRLEKIITDFNLYPEERKAGIMQDIVDQMQTRDLKVQVYKGDAFRVSFEGSQPRLVAQVADRLASLFIEESLRDRTTQTEGTSSFLEAQLDDARRRLIEQEKKLEAYRMKYSGQLPTQLDSNLQAIQNVQMQVQSLVESMNRIGDRRLIVQRQLADIQAGLGVPDDPANAGLKPPQQAAPDGTISAPISSSTADRLAAAKSNLAMLRQRGLTTEHPDVQTLQRLVDQLQKKLDDEALQQPVSAASTVALLPPGELARQKRLVDLQSELEQLDKQSAASQAEETRLRSVAADIQKRVDAVPARESELTELMRDYGTLQKLYEQLLGRKEEANISANLERRQIGEQFRLLDPAHLPEKPVSPNRKAINLMGMGIGFGLGLALVVLFEYRDSSFQNDEEVRTFLSVPVLAVVPFMESDKERKRAMWKRWALNIALGSTVMGCLAVLAYTFVR